MLKTVCLARSGNFDEFRAIFNIQYINKGIFSIFETLYTKSPLGTYLITVIVKYPKHLKCFQMVLKIPKGFPKN